MGSDVFRANVRHCERWNIILFSYNLTVACHICVQPMVDYIGFTRTVGVFGFVAILNITISVAVLTCRRFDQRPLMLIQQNKFY